MGVHDETVDMRGMRVPARSETTNTTATINDGIIGMDAVGGERTVTLPPLTQAVLNGRGLQLIIKRLNSGGNNVIVAGAGSDQIDGSSTVSLGNQFSTAMLIATGVQWFVIN